MFSGKLGEDINELIATDIEAELEIKLRATSESSYLLNFMKGEARLFYRSNVQPTWNNFLKPRIEL